MKLARPLTVIIGAWALLLASTLAYGHSQRQEEAERYYEKWLNQDVVYLITEDERKVFEKLSTPAEKDQFIEQFWARRDPDPSTSINEYKEEHYRRLAYVNQRFGSGVPGWKTDRGRVYIMFGEPAQIEYNAGGSYVRKPYEGGGRTATFPFEVWYYRHIPGVGSDIEIEFVDRSFSGEFKMALYPWEKDMLLHVDGLGETNAERLGLVPRYLRPGLHPGNMNNMNFQKKYMGMRNKDAPFERLLRYFRLQKPPEIKQKELQKIVENRVSYDVLPFSAYIHHVWISRADALIPVTIQVPNRELTYVDQEDRYKARIAIYGRVTAMTGELVTEFEQTLSSVYPAAHIEIGRSQKSVFQKIVAAQPGRYKLELVIQDLNSRKVGTLFQGIHVPALEEEQLTTSPIVLAEQLQPLGDFPETPTSFVIGDVRVVPNVSRRFKPEEELGIYLQVHNAGIDQSTSAPDVEVEYLISRDGKVVNRLTDLKGNSIEYVSSERLVLVRKVKLDQLEKGRYEVVVKVSDSLTGQSTQSRASFEVVG